MRPVLRSVPRLSPRTLPPPHHLPSCHPHRTLTSPGRASLPHHASYPPDALDAPLRPPHPSRPSDRVLPLTAREETLLRAKTVFGDGRSAAAEERRAKMEGESRMIAGVRVPPRPEEPEDCCMSGCVNCVWEVYREDLEEWVGKKAEARRRGGMMLEDEDGGGKVRCVGGVDDGGGGGGGGREGNRGGGDGVEERVKAGKGGEGDGEGDGDPLEGIPVGIREFMKTERKLKQRHREAGEVWEKALDKDLRASVWGSGT